jgi:nitroreductase
MLRDLVLKNRTIRRFVQNVPVSLETLSELVDCGRLSASGANRQPLKYVIVNLPELNAKVFPHK